MASVHRRPDSAYWHAAWRGENGKLFFRSTKQTNRQKALSVALQYERAAKLAKAGVFTETQARRVLNDILEITNVGDELRSPTVQAWFKEWLQAKEASRSEGTCERYRGVTDNFVAHLGDRAKRPLSGITARDIQSFVTLRQKDGCSSRTVQLDVKILRAGFNRARQIGIISANPAEAVEMPEAKSIERGTFSPAEVKMLVEAADGEWKTLILFGYFTAARLSDCCKIVWTGDRFAGNQREGVDLSQATLTFWQQKTGKLITVPLHPTLLAHLERLASSDKPDRFVTPGMASKGPGGRHGLSEGFKRIVRRTGLDLETVQGTGKRKISRRTFHALRHSFTSALANAGVAPELRMKLTGHSSAAVHRGYTHHELGALRQAVGKLADIV